MRILKIAKAILQIAPLAVDPVNAQAADHFCGFYFRQNGAAAIALLLGIVVFGMPFCGMENRIAQLMNLGFGFLQADNICTLASHPAEETLGGGRADTVQIGGNDAHIANCNVACSR